MNRTGGHVSCCWLVTAAIVAALAGCKKSGPVTPARPTPQASFKVIAEDFRRGIEITVPGVAARQNDGSLTAFTTKNIVTDELIPPANDDEPFRAKITVTTRSRVSRTPGSGETKSNREDSGQNDDSGTTGTSTLEPDADILDPALVSSPASTRAGRRGGRAVAGDAPVMRPPDEDVKTYELVYHNNRWDLVTEVNLDTDSAVQRAFVHALKTQL